ncbi:MAG: hypothetical protein JXR48_03130 [Candidatus Delongbacteria bacterium]|nr:hypothetical protein [Candidatus Delongbacteria bacterium]MBN2833942.1 hypothetical protein [Candidatus Delongbacteria bacterium]
MKNIIVAIILFAMALIADPAKITIAELNTKAETIVDQEITFIGVAEHVCAHGGQKLYATDGTNKFKITPSKEIGAFNSNMSGEKFTFVGFVREFKLDNDYLDKWEAELDAAGAKKAEEDTPKNCEYDKNSTSKDEKHADNSVYKQIADLREQIKNTEKGYLSYFSVECTSFTKE